nr:choice-of-anchor L domain-containing protein [uncultured Methanolobus sp.]
MKTKVVITIILLLALITCATATAERTGNTHSANMMVQPASTSSTGTFTTTDLDTITKEQVVSTILGTGVSVTQIRVTGENACIGTFSDENKVLGMSQGIILSTGNIADTAGPNTDDATTTDYGLSGDSDLDGLIPGYETHDAIILEIDFIPEGSQLEFNYVFGSEEYNEYVDSEFNDVFGFFLNGQNVALIPGTNEPVAINNINLNKSSAYYNNNDFDELDPIPYDIELDGFTSVLTATGQVTPMEVNTIKIAIADAGDHILDSAVLIEANSFSSADFFLTPETATNTVGETHEVKAKLLETTENGVFPVNGETVTFKVVSGPNEGKTGSSATDINGVATWSYSSSVSGTDTIKAFVDSVAYPDMESNEITKIWVGGQTSTEVPEFPTIALPVFAIIGIALFFQRRK